LRTRVLSLRLPADHWLWREKDRQEVVRAALETYRGVGDRLDALLQKVEEIARLLQNARVVPANPTKDGGEQKSMPGVDPRLVKALDKFLDL